jgi:hypothetical protein
VLRSITGPALCAKRTYNAADKLQPTSALSEGVSEMRRRSNSTGPYDWLDDGPVHIYATTTSQAANTRQYTDVDSHLATRLIADGHGILGAEKLETKDEKDPDNLLDATTASSHPKTKSPQGRAVGEEEIVQKMLLDPPVQ